MPKRSIDQFQPVQLKNVSRAYCPNVYIVAKEKYSAQLIADTKILLKLLVLYLPLPIYWALFDQQVSTF